MKNFKSKNLNRIIHSINNDNNSDIGINNLLNELQDY